MSLKRLEVFFTPLKFFSPHSLLLSRIHYLREQNRTSQSYREFQHGPKTSPGFRAFRRVTKQIEGPAFSDTFSQNDQTKCARSEAPMDIRNTLAQEHYGTRLGSPVSGGELPRGSNLVIIDTSYPGCPKAKSSEHPDHTSLGNLVGEIA